MSYYSIVFVNMIDLVDYNIASLSSIASVSITEKRYGI